MNQRDERLGYALRSLDVPDHRPDFYARLQERLDQEPAGTGPTHHRRRRKRPPMLFSVGLSVAALLLAVVAASAMLTKERPDVVVAGPSPTTITGPATMSQTVPNRPTNTTPGPTITSGSTPPTTRPGMTALTAASTLDVGGLGPVRVGMTPAEATVAAGIPIVASGTGRCSYATATGGPDGVAFMLTNGRIARVDVGASSPVKTLSGAGIGDPEPQVQARYSNTLEVSVHKYNRDGRYLTLVPVDAADKDSRLIFETDGSRVTMIRSGQLPEVAYVEGCG